ncbi:uncharacterized protein LOC129216675 [Uloborus diversus]|uniref:uncharacterized protein LOC129216675 n=1 Tax=Uloborus diversus TaxID=327109 RepID=UPI0024094C88|nr:uncharacterized protein LOC129216675 [Uloborus diversus]
MNGPDSGYAWCVAFAACVINFIMAGLGRMSGILYVAFIDMFQIDRRGASIPFSIRSSARNLLGPVVGILGQKYSVRTVAITGGVIGTISGACCFYADNMLWISVLWGGINGVGTAMTTTLNQVVIGQYFKKYRTTAAGMGFSGGCVGSFIFPVLLEELLRSYGIQGTFLIMAGIIMHTIPAAMILRKPWWVKKRNKENRTKEPTGAGNGRRFNTESMRSDDVIFSADLPCLDESKPGPHVQIENLKNLVDFEFLSQNIDIIADFLNVSETLEMDKRTHGTPVEVNAHVNKAFEPEQRKTQDDFALVLEILNNYVGNDCLIDRNISALFRQHLFMKKNGAFNTNENNRHHELKQVFMQKLKFLANLELSQILSHFSLEKNEHLCRLLTEIKKLLVLNDEVEKSALKEPSVTIGKLKQMAVLDESNSKENSAKNKNETSTSYSTLLKAALKLHTKPIFLLICFCRCVHFLTFVPVVAFIVDFTMDKGLKEEDGKYVIAALSLGDLLGRIGLGWLTDRNYIKLPRYMLLVMLLQGCCTAVMPFVNTKPALFPLLCVFGLLQGSLFVRHPVLVNKYIDSNEQSIAMGCMNFFSGLLGFALPSYIGYFRDKVGSYDGMFYINSVIGTAIGLLWILEPYLVKLSSVGRTEHEL